MRLAIVGTSKLSEIEELDARKFIALTLKTDPEITEVVSGGADGIDKIAKEVAEGLGIKPKVFSPDVKEWEPNNGSRGFKARDLEIAEYCDKLLCISKPVLDKECYHHKGQPPQKPHQRTGGCWTLKQVLNMGKPTNLYIL